MVKLIVGVKGTGKTKTLISMVNEAVEKTQGSVVCIEKGVKLRYDLKYQVRLINSNEYLIFDAQSLYGFVAGVMSANHDVTDLFVDSTLKICNQDMAAFEKLILELDELTETHKVNIVMTASITVEECPDGIKAYA